MFVPAPKLASLDAIWVCNGETVENTFHYQFAANATEAELTGLCDTYMTWADANNGQWHPATLFVKCVATDLSSSSGHVVTTVHATPIEGAATGTDLPNNVSFAVKRNTNLRGRANRGRLYLFGLTTDSLGVGSQDMSAAKAIYYIGKYNSLMNQQFTDNAADEVVYHRSAGTGTHVVEYTFSDVHMDSQRRRLPGHNRHH